MSALLNHDAVIPSYQWRNGTAQTRRIQSMVAESFGLAGREVMLKRCSESRFRDARAVAYYLCRKLTPCSWPELGRAFGGRDHTCGITACRRIEQRLDVDSELSEKIAALEAAIKASTQPPDIRPLVKPSEIMPEWARRLEAKLDRLLEAKA